MRTVFSWMIAVVLMVALALAAGAATPPIDDEFGLQREETMEVAEAPLPDSDEAEDDANRQLLLRDGSHLLHARGRVEHDAKRRAWLFHMAPHDSAAPHHKLRILPSRFLGEVQQIVEASAAASGRETGTMAIGFELTGQVFAYRERNYLLVTHPPRVLGEVATSVESGTESDSEEAGRSIPAADEPRNPLSAEALLREMDRAGGPVHRAPAGQGGQPTGQRTRHVAPVPEGTMIVYRRGRIVRDAGGALAFIFEADVTGLADPPLTLLPCLLLQRIEYYADRAGSTAPVLLSGRVYANEGRSYLLPSVFQIPRERSEIRP
jgi:hypothetical protein